MKVWLSKTMIQSFISSCLCQQVVLEFILLISALKINLARKKPQNYCGYDLQNLWNDKTDSKSFLIPSTWLLGGWMLQCLASKAAIPDDKLSPGMTPRNLLQPVR